MAQLDKPIKTFIKDIEKFIAVTLKSVQLPSAAKTQWSGLLKSLETLKKKYPSLQSKDEADQDDLYTDAEDTYYEMPPDKEFSAATMKDADKVGLLKKKDKKKAFGASSKKWCAIKQGVFYMFEKQNSKKQTDVFSLSGYQVKDSSSSKREFCFELSGPENKSYVFAVSTEDERTGWVTAIKKATNKPVRPVEDVIEEVNYSTATGEDSTQDVSYENKEEAGEIYDEATSLPTGKNPRVVSEVIYDEAASHPLEESEDQTYEDTEIASPDENSGTSKASVRSSNSYDGYARPPDVPPKNFMDMVPYESLYFGLWDCSADNDTELTFKRGDMIRVVGEEYESYNWLTCVMNEKVGLVPKDYLTPAYARS